jgi:hypothetical protein
VRCIHRTATGHCVGTALKKVLDPILDLWLIVAEFARESWTQNIDRQFNASGGEEVGSVM